MPSGSHGLAHPTPRVQGSGLLKVLDSRPSHDTPESFMDLFSIFAGSKHSPELILFWPRSCFLGLCGHNLIFINVAPTRISS